MFMMYLDLAELPGLFRQFWLWSGRRRAPAWFRRADHAGDPSVPLDETIRNLVEERITWRPTGPIRLLTHMRYFGYCFNPVSFFYCFDEADERLECIVAEVNNTPWGERHCYVLPEPMNLGRGANKRFLIDKEMHVSPFMEMDVDYDWRFSTPAESLAVHMINERDGRPIFDATLALDRREISSRSLARVLVAYPLMTLKVLIAIHWQALRLWLKGVPFRAHPDKEAPAAASQT
jgi:DUF1365 family protein